MMYSETDNLWVAALVEGIVTRLHILNKLNLTHHYQKAV